jgi:hypothetical protein
VTGFALAALDRSTWDAFAALVKANDGVFGGCWCIGLHAEGGDEQATYERNREVKLARVRAGTTHAALVLDGADCVGWCQFGPPADLPRISDRPIGEHRWVVRRVVEPA